MFCFCSGSRRGSIASTNPEDVDLGWLAWRQSRRSESRRWRRSGGRFRRSNALVFRSSVVSISGEDHGVPSVKRWTRSVCPLTYQIV